MMIFHGALGATTANMTCGTLSCSGTTTATQTLFVNLQKAINVLLAKRRLPVSQLVPDGKIGTSTQNAVRAIGADLSAYVTDPRSPTNPTLNRLVRLHMDGPTATWKNIAENAAAYLNDITIAASVSSGGATTPTPTTGSGPAQVPLDQLLKEADAKEAAYKEAVATGAATAAELAALKKANEEAQKKVEKATGGDGFWSKLPQWTDNPSTNQKLNAIGALLLLWGGYRMYLRSRAPAPAYRAPAPASSSAAVAGWNLGRHLLRHTRRR